MRSGVMRLILAAVLVCAARSLAAQTLGRIEFPTSGAVAAQARFLVGVGYLHSFEYDSAAAAFRAAQRLDSTFAMAYWGEAMSYTHPVWNEKDSSAAREALVRLAPTAGARQALAPTERERGYLRAVEVLYGGGGKARLDTLYAAEMERLSAAFPDDDEARSFYALALLGLSQGERVVPTYMRAGALAQDVLRRNPRHPGALHYAIHAFDDPMHAPLGLHVARTYSQVAPDAPHAQHMTTHIFLALGLWDETIAQNVIAAGPDRTKWTPGHYTLWLLYGLLQAGRHDEARELLEVTHANSSPRHAGSLGWMAAHYLVDSERWSDPVAAWPVPAEGRGPMVAAGAFARAYAAMKRGDTVELQRWRAVLGARAAHAGAEFERVLADMLAGAEASAGGRHGEAVRILAAAEEQVSIWPVEFGPPALLMPVPELLGEVLLAAGRHDDAAAAFSRALALQPGRWKALRGLEAARLH